MNLYSKLKPEVKTALLTNNEDYSKTIKRLLNTLKKLKHYGELTIDDISAIHTFADISLVKLSSWDFRFGDHLFNKK
jgi:hypothetical protein